MHTPAEWTLTEKALRRTIIFPDFREALAFVNKVAVLAETAQHHPDITITYNHVTLLLTSHDAGNTVTARDVTLAEKINLLL